MITVLTAVITVYGFVLGVMAVPDFAQWRQSRGYPTEQFYARRVLGWILWPLYVPYKVIVVIWQITRVAIGSTEDKKSKNSLYDDGETIDIIGDVYENPNAYNKYVSDATKRLQNRSNWSE